MALNEMIAQGAQFNMPDPVAQYNKLAQMQQYQSQNELNRQEAIDKATERQRIVSERSKRSTFLTQFGAKLAEKGVALNKTTVADMISSGVPEIEKLGFKALEAMQFDESYNTAMGVGGGAANAPAPMAAAPAPMAAATPIPKSGVSPSNIGAETFVSTGVGATNFNGTATKFNPTTGEIEPVPLRENQAAAGLFDSKTKTYSPAFGTLALTAPQILTRLNNKLATLTNNPPEGMTPQMRAEMIAATKEEIIATAAGKRDMFTPTNEMAPQAPAAAAVTNAMAPAPTPIPTAAPASELERLIAQRSKLSRIRPENPGEIATLTNTLKGIDEQIKRLTTTGSNLSKLMAERDKLLAGDPRIAIFDDAIKKESQNVAKAEPLADFAAFLRLSPTEQDTFLKFKRAGAGNVSATATTGPVGKSLSEPVGKRVETSLLKAEGATSMMDTANSVREALNAGNVIAGPLAGVRTKFAQVLELAGAGDKEKLVNTRTAIQGLAALTLESRAELRGQGQITDTETKLLEKARSADINDLTIPELQQVVNVSQRLASRLFSNHETLLSRMKDDPAAKDSMRYYEPTGTLAKPLLESKTPAAQSKDEKRPSLGSIFGNPPQGVK